MKEIYVSPKGNDFNDGSFEKPFLTIKKAKNYIKTINDDVVVYLREGRYFFSNTVRFNNEDKQAVYKAYNNEKVYFDGGVVIDSKDAVKVTDEKILDRIIEEKGKDNVFEIDLSKYIKSELGEYGIRGFRRSVVPSGNELFIESSPYTVARYPKDNYIPLTNVVDSGSCPKDEDYSVRGAVIGYNGDRLKKWQYADDAYIFGFFKACYADDTIKIEKIDVDNNTISTTIPHLYSFVSGEETRWKILNLLEEISEPGEYFIDRKQKKCYFYPNCKIEDNTLIQISVLDTPMLSFVEASFITFENVIFENSRGTGVYIEGGESIAIRDCTFRNLGIIAVQIGMGSTNPPDGKFNCHGKYANDVEKCKLTSEQLGNFNEHIYEKPALDGNGGKNHLITGCEIYNTGVGGISLGGGNRKKLVPANNKVFNTHIYKTNRLEITYRPGVHIWGVGNVISHCELEDLEGHGIIIHGNDHLIEYSKMHNIVKQLSDGGVIYMGRDPSEVGNKIRYNFIYDVKNPHSYDMYGFAAIYFDDNAIYNEVYGNYFYDIVQRGPFLFGTVHWNCGGQTSVANNIFIDCYPGLDPNSYDNSYEKMHNEELFIGRVHTENDEDMNGVDVTSDIWKEKYPYLYDTYTQNYDHTTVKYNNFVCCNQYHNFVDENPSHINFKLKKSSYLLSKFAANVVDRVRGINKEKVMFEEVDFDKIGLINKR